MAEEPIDFGNLELAEKRVKIDGEAYVLREASEDVACKYQNARGKELTLGPDGRPTALRNMADTDPYLLSLCLFKDGDKGRQPVAVQVIRQWPQRVVNPLVALAKKISRIDDEETAEALEQRIKDDTAKLARLRNGHAEQAEKNS